MNIGDNIKELRKYRKLTQKQLAKMINKSIESIKKYESGDIEPPVSVLEKISEKLNVPFYELIKNKLQVGENISKYRKAKKLTQEQLANKLGIATGSMQNYELNKRKPNYEILNKLSIILDVSIDELVNGESHFSISEQKPLSQYTTEELLEELLRREVIKCDIVTQE